MRGSAGDHAATVASDVTHDARVENAQSEVQETTDLGRAKVRDDRSPSCGVEPEAKRADKVPSHDKWSVQ